MMRNTGETTRQMQGAPIGAIFVVPHEGAMLYSRKLAHFLGRKDIQLVTIYDVEKVARGTRRMIIVDHAFDVRDARGDICLKWVDVWNDRTLLPTQATVAAW
jgi:hypothetical protein